MKKFIPIPIPIPIAVLIVCMNLNMVIAEETAYVTDSLQLRLFAEASDKSKIIQTMESGESVEIIETKGAFSHVRTYDNAIGWVKSSFLVSETPPTLLYYTVSEENKKLKQELEILKNNTSVFSEERNDDEANQQSVSKIAELEQNLLQQRDENQKLQKQLASVQENKRNLLLTESINGVVKKPNTFNKLAFQTSSLSLDKILYLLAGLLTFLLFGIILGVNFSSRRMRKRLHGFKLD